VKIKTFINSVSFLFLMANYTKPYEEDDLHSLVNYVEVHKPHIGSNLIVGGIRKIYSQNDCMMGSLYLTEVPSKENMHFLRSRERIIKHRFSQSLNTKN
jgi:hypothetical protein